MMDKQRAYTWNTTLLYWINICVSRLVKLFTGRSYNPKMIIIIIPVKMHSYWYCLTHRNIATSLILYQKLDLNNKVFVCVSVIKGRIRIIARMRSISF